MQSLNCLLYCLTLLLWPLVQIHAQGNLSANNNRHSEDASLSGASRRTSQWVYQNGQGKLSYKTLERGDRIPDYSYAGYKGGGVAIPLLPVKITLSPAAGDNTDAIQQAIDAVSGMPLVNGSRGAVLLQPGIYDCERPLVIRASGVVLRGSGAGADGTVIRMTGNPHACITITGMVTAQPIGDAVRITDSYVPVNASSFTVNETGGLAPGDTIRITRPVTPAWVHFMGMDQLTRDGKQQTWISGDIVIDRVIKSITHNTITVGLPLTDNYDARYLNPPGVTVSKVTLRGGLFQTGIEDLRMAAPDQTGTINEAHHRAFTMKGVRDSWARNIEIQNTINSVSISDAKRITVERVRITHTMPTVGSAKPADLNGSGSQLLFNQCYIKGDNVFYFATGPKVSGPVVLLHCTFEGNGWIQPHQRWATVLLVDGCNVPDGGIDFMNRGAMGSGHGWAIGWAVAWNCKARSYLNQQPPGAANWVIGSQGAHQQRARPFDKTPLLEEGIYDAAGEAVTPNSLYLAQLAERLGAQAVKNVGY
ncbi:hypothetical protein F0L74_31980 [Chitinophaga agrisoli]|uniref:Pectate lyase-like protein n=1 Tax=Chitinophaga agrisoli TaxID=2607653 RepID=A0A5B2VQ06_9BACT|nr:hypothetical protein [Chitinophaga agrisoli]KAA2240758.1 hypothetical protein F0L74_31980 [Chitinophaga agrisoli]